jgi:chorismate dehydratase
MKKLRITAVSYLNTLPFVYGFKMVSEPDFFDLSLDVPSLCAQKMITGQADIGLVPVGALNQIGPSCEMMNYCIAADGEVSSVLLVSKVPLNEIKRVHLDRDSRTSVLLARVLASEYWSINPQWKHFTSQSDQDLPDSAVIIGDKAFGYRKKYPYSWDLSSEWKALTGLPFVFAVWLARKNIDTSLLGKVSSALEYGISHIDDTVIERMEENPVNIDLKNYLTHNIHFRLEEKYRKGLELFLRYTAQLKEN